MEAEAALNELRPAGAHGTTSCTASPPSLQDHVTRLVASAPPLTSEQQQRLRCLLNMHGHEYADAPLAALAA
jgi:5'-3' exonuclease